MRKVIYLSGLFFVVGFAYYLGLTKSSNNSVQEKFHSASAKKSSDKDSLEYSQSRSIEPITSKVDSPQLSPKNNSDANKLVTELPHEKISSEIATKAVDKNIRAEGKNGLIIVDNNSRLPYRYTFDEEDRLESWAAPSEQLLSESVQHSEFGSRYKLESLECKTTVCITKVSISADKTNDDIEMNFGWPKFLLSIEQSKVGQSFSDHSSTVYQEESAVGPRIIYESAFIKKNDMQD